MTQHNLDLKAKRCPEAMLIIRKSLKAAAENGFCGEVLIKTIEPSVTRDLKHFLNQIERKVTVETCQEELLSPELMAAWIDEGEATEEELEGISTLNLTKLKFN